MQILKALAAQVLGVAFAALFINLIGIWPIVALQALAAAAFSHLLRQPYWWKPIHLLFVPAAAGLLTLQLPSWVFLMATIMLGLVFWGTVKGDVPLFLSSAAVTNALKNIIEHENASSFIDLGAGIGSVTAPLARHRPEMLVDAWESAPIPWAIASYRSRKLPNTAVLRKSFWECDLSPYDVVFAFLSPAPMPQLGEKALREMHPGSLLVSSTFAIPDWEPETTVQLEDQMHTTLYCYRIK